MSVQAQFDQYAENYDAALQATWSATGENREFFARGRIEWLRRCLHQLGQRPNHVLDFGCATGSNAPLLLEILQCHSVLGVDVSGRCIEQARRLHAAPGARFETLADYQPDGSMDVVHCNGVFHHIRLAERPAALEIIYESLRPGGFFGLWENNPWNPGTLYCMSRCAFDKDAITISPPEARRMLRAAGFQPVREDFLFYFPRFLSRLRRLEPLLIKVPLGGQYQVLARKPE